MSLETLPEFQLAAAALATLEPKPGQPYIPVVTIWGEKGSGKTTIARQVASHWRSRLGIQSTLLTRGSVLATRRLSDTQRVPLARLGRPELMVIDGFEQLPAKVALPFARLLDRREQRGLASVIMINQPPQQLKWPERLIHRLSGSMVVEIPWLAATSREMAFDTFLSRHRVHISRQVKTLMAAFLGPTIGCIEKQAKTVAEGHAKRLPADDLVRLCQQASIRVSLDQIVQLVTISMGLDRKSVLGPGREPTLVRARQLIVVLAREHTELSLAKLGKALGGRDPATLRHAITAFRSSTDEGLKRQTAAMSRQLEACRWGTRC